MCIFWLESLVFFNCFCQTWESVKHLSKKTKAAFGWNTNCRCFSIIRDDSMLPANRLASFMNDGALVMIGCFCFLLWPLVLEFDTTVNLIILNSFSENDWKSKESPGSLAGKLYTVWYIASIWLRQAALRSKEDSYSLSNKAGLLECFSGLTQTAATEQQS